MISQAITIVSSIDEVFDYRSDELLTGYIREHLLAQLRLDDSGSAFVCERLVIGNGDPAVALRFELVRNGESKARTSVLLSESGSGVLTMQVREGATNLRELALDPACVVRVTHDPSMALMHHHVSSCWKGTLEFPARVLVRDNR